MISLRRVLAVLVLGISTIVYVGISPAPAHAAAPITGTLYDYVSRLPAPGTTVQLRALDDLGAPAAVVATGDTDATGAFSVAPPDPADDEYYVEVVGDARIQGGWVDGRSPNYVQWAIEEAATHAPGSTLGRVWGLPSFVRGKLVNAANGNPVRNVTVDLHIANKFGDVAATDVTDLEGRFRLGPIVGEDFGLKVLGEPRGFETGWRACDGTVVRTWGAACASPIGQIGRVRVDRL